ncbi:uncharacterized protein LOC6032392 isoform X2 [Culex quinquefasciatus]|uniref:uncharacterized protein LOC6032392 isoform X2 n=1 Tax=Culex quinquefasciatus TaxID=7176 RepID=UPI0018E392A3|nr:uncharacterized protein LOC6032392 isoform X2 [Culex quinquefasciatus]
MVFVRSMLNSAKRIPMIRFRKGGPHLDAAGQSAPATQAGQARSVSTGEAIEEWQLPARYRRKPIDDVEIEWINRGGPPA